jgi:5-(carboxyamino)imidazole ribonucleotide synthase
VNSSSQTHLPPQPLHPQSLHRVGVIGGGQLAWMLASAAKPLDLHLVVQTPQADDPAVSLAESAILAAIDDVAATASLAQQCQVITFENEFVDLPGLAQLQAKGVCFRPGLATLQPLLDKYDQRSYLQSLGLAVPQFASLTPTVLDEFSLPLVVKARRHGYDGQGTFIVHHPEQLTRFWQSGSPEQIAAKFMVEAFVPFERELAVLMARGVTGEIKLHPLVETQQEQQVCRRAWVAQDLSESVYQQCGAMAERLLTKLEVVGLWGMELFLTTTGQVLVNEIAPRTHNSGHLSIEACETSQFEQHLRAICGLPLGSTALKAAGAVMVNLLGFETATSDYQDLRRQLAALPQAKVYWYGKTQARPGRKLGHVTLLLESHEREAAMAAAAQVEQIWYGAAAKL